MLVTMRTVVRTMHDHRATIVVMMAHPRTRMIAMTVGMAATILNLGRNALARAALDSCGNAGAVQ